MLAISYIGGLIKRSYVTRAKSCAILCQDLHGPEIDSCLAAVTSDQFTIESMNK